MLKFGKKKGDKAAEAGEGETPPAAEGEAVEGEGQVAVCGFTQVLLAIESSIDSPTRFRNQTLTHSFNQSFN